MSFDPEYNFPGDLGEMNESLADMVKYFGEFDAKVRDLASAYEEYLTVDSGVDISVVQLLQTELINGFLNYANVIASEGFEDKEFSHKALNSSIVLVETVHANIISKSRLVIEASSKDFDLDLEIEMDETPLDELSKAIADQLDADAALVDDRFIGVDDLQVGAYSTGENLASFLADRFKRFNGVIEKLANAKKESLEINIDMLDPLISRELELKKIDKLMTLAYVDYVKTGRETSMVAYRSARRQIEDKFIDYVNDIIDGDIGVDYSRKAKIKTIANFVSDIELLHRDALRGCLIKNSALKPELELSEKENAEIRRKYRQEIKDIYDFEISDDIEESVDNDEDEVGMAEIGDSIFWVIESIFDRDDDWIDDLRIENSQPHEKLRRLVGRLGSVAVVEALRRRLKKF